MKMKTGKSKHKVARRLGLPVPSKNGYHTHRLRMRDLPLIFAASRAPTQPRSDQSA